MGAGPEGESLGMLQRIFALLLATAALSGAQQSQTFTGTITDDNNKFFVDAALGSPRTLVGDTLAKARKKPKVEGVIEKMVLRDETRTIELHHIAKLEHSDGMLIAYLPKERILFTADFDAPAPGERASSSIVTLAQNLERLAIDFDRHVPVHPAVPDRPMTRAELLALAKGAD